MEASEEGNKGARLPCKILQPAAGQTRQERRTREKTPGAGREAA